MTIKKFTEIVKENNLKVAHIDNGNEYFDFIIKYDSNVLTAVGHVNKDSNSLVYTNIFGVICYWDLQHLVDIKKTCEGNK